MSEMNRKLLMHDFENKMILLCLIQYQLLQKGMLAGLRGINLSAKILYPKKKGMKNRIG